MKILIPLLLALLLVIGTVAYFMTNTQLMTEQTNHVELVKTKLGLTPNLPGYLFDKELKNNFPATWKFYEKLNIINRDKIYSYYLYNPDIKKVRHKIFNTVLKNRKDNY